MITQVFGQRRGNISLLSTSAGFLNFFFFSLQVYCVTLLATGEKLAAKEVQIDLQIPQTKEVTILLLIKVKITL